jgi:glycerophosphoryl diester phosphodiesterase
VADRRPLVIAHRGASAVETENTIAAFTRAIEMGGDAVEFDIRRTRDGELVVFHDEAVGGRRLDEMTLAGLRDTAGVEVPTLAEALAATRGRIGLNVELKEAGYEDEVVAAIRDGFGLDDVAFTSFSASVVAAIAARHPAVRGGLILDRAETPDAAVRRLRESGASLVAASYRLLQRAGFRDAFATAGYPIYVWTVNEPDAMRRLFADPAVGGVLSDLPDVAVAVRREVLGGVGVRPG